MTLTFAYRSTIASRSSPLNISGTVRGLGTKDDEQEMAYEKSNGNVTDDVT